jgi:probable H4MPT-linked C1 transfer pathway protein
LLFLVSCLTLMSTLGLDIGGANLKAAHQNGTARVQPFALWRAPTALPEALGQLLQELPHAQVLAVTMTGELCDCFASKRDGVAAILDAVTRAARGATVIVWSTSGRFLTPDEARTQPLAVAAANWHSLATWAGRLAPNGPAFLLDIGSTTSDLVPLLDGKPTPRGLTDPQRLRSGELVYTGARRTPVCAVLTNHVAAEFFATMYDVYLVLGAVPEDPDDLDTADGRPATRDLAHARLARLLCADLESCTLTERMALAESAASQQQWLLEQGARQVLRRLPAPLRTMIVSGSGEFIARRLVREQPVFGGVSVVSLSETLGPGLSNAACAHALAVLAAEAGHGGS